MNNLEDILWICYRTFPKNVVDEVEPENLACMIRTFCPEVLMSTEEIVDRICVLRKYRQQLAELRNIPYIAQRTQEWYDLRKKRLTASDTAQAIGKGKFGTREQLVQKKVNEAHGIPDNFPKHLPALKWGIMFEAMATRCYAQRHHDIDIHEFGLIPHPNLDYYGASPDGITDMGIMIEIKCPYKRKITGEVPDYYELQIQGQMAVCGLRECDYVECELQEFDRSDDYMIMVGEDVERDHGVIVEYVNEHGDALYDYSAPYLTPMAAYANATKMGARRVKSNPNLRVVKLRPWKLRYMNIVRIQFDDDRWDALVPKLRSFWDDVTIKQHEPVKDVTNTMDMMDKKSKKKKYEFIEESDED